MTSSRTPHTWAIGEAYEPYVGRWSRLVAREFIPWLSVTTGGRWLDVGCGTGALSAIVLEHRAPAALLGVDPSDGFVSYARTRFTDDRVRFAVGDALALPPDLADLDAAVAGLVLNFVPDPVLAAREMRRVVRPGGIVGAYVWDYAGGMAMMRLFWAAAAALDPSATARDEGQRFNAVCSPAGLSQVLRDAGLRQVATLEITVPTLFRDFEDYWSPFLSGQGVAPAYVTTLDAERRDLLRDRLRSTLPIAADGSIALSARAWAVKG